jgi:hypothetical protein
MSAETDNITCIPCVRYFVCFHQMDSRLTVSWLEGSYRLSQRPCPGCTELLTLLCVPGLLHKRPGLFVFGALNLSKHQYVGLSNTSTTRILTMLFSTSLYHRRHHHGCC